MVLLPCTQAAKYGHCQHIDILIRYGADINAQNLVGNTPLHVAASHGQVLILLDYIIHMYLYLYCNLIGRGEVSIIFIVDVSY